MSVVEIVAALRDTEALIKSQLERVESGDGDEGARRALEVLGETWDGLIGQLDRANCGPSL
jgi:hypothetical protein